MINLAVIPAAGLGTRMKQIAHGKSKEILPLGGKEAIFYLLEEIVDSSINKGFIIINKNKLDIPKAILKSDYNEALVLSNAPFMVSIKGKSIEIVFVLQEVQLGLGHAIMQVEPFVNEAFVVLLGDDIYRCDVPATKQLMQAYEKANSDIVGVMEIPKGEIHKYGLVVPVKDNGQRLLELNDFIEKPIQCNIRPLSSLGRYVLTMDIFKELSKNIIGINNEIQLTDAMKRLIDYKKVYSYTIEGKRFDIGNPSDYSFAAKTFK